MALLLSNIPSSAKHKGDKIYVQIFARMIYSIFDSLLPSVPLFKLLIPIMLQRSHYCKKEFATTILFRVVVYNTVLALNS